MKITLLVTALAFLAAPALAESEGNGEPFPLILPPIATTMTAGPVGSNQNPFPYYAARSSSKLTAGTVGANQNPFPYAVAGVTRAYNPATATPDQSAAAAAATRTRVSTR